MAPRSIIIPNKIDAVQFISGALWISGATLCFMKYDGTDGVVALA